MAKFSGFQPRQDVYHAQLRRVLLANSITVKAGDAIVPHGSTDGVATNVTSNVAGSYFILGVVQGFSGPAGQIIAQGLTSVGTQIAQVATSSANVTAAYDGTVTGGQVCAMYIPVTVEMEYLATLSGAAGTTQSYSGKAFTNYNLSDARTVDETSVTQYGVGASPLQVLTVPSDGGVTSALDPNGDGTTEIVIKFNKGVMYRP